jgi:hypothetical protein
MHAGVLALLWDRLSRLASPIAVDETGGIEVADFR